VAVIAGLPFCSPGGCYCGFDCFIGSLCIVELSALSCKTWPFEPRIHTQFSPGCSDDYMGRSGRQASVQQSNQQHVTEDPTLPRPDSRIMTHSVALLLAYQQMHATHAQNEDELKAGKPLPCCTSHMQSQCSAPQNGSHARGHAQQHSHILCPLNVYT
jgi:hypothetical protein